MRAGLQALVVGLVLGVAGLPVSAQSDNPRVGTWHNNLSKSKYSPGPAPKSQVVRIEAAGDGERVTSETTSDDGTKVVTSYTAQFDGRDYPLKGSPLADSVSITRVDSHTSVRSDKKGGKVMQTLTRVVSKDGKTMTVTIKGVNTRGQTVSHVLVFEKK